MTKTQIAAVPVAINGKTRWHFATPSVLIKGQQAKSLKTWASKRDALEAGRREFGA